VPERWGWNWEANLLISEEIKKRPWRQKETIQTLMSQGVTWDLLSSFF